MPFLKVFLASVRACEIALAIMGIKGFAAWLRSSFPQAFCALPSSQKAHFDQVFVDLNAYLHMAARLTDSRDGLMTIFRRMLRHSLTNLARPNSLLYLAMDGPASLAKLPEQRARRRDAAVSSLKRNCFDAQQITPGCSFMTSVEAELYAVIYDSFFVSSSRKSHLTAVIDGAACVGEGEYKIIRKLLVDHIDSDAMKGRVTRAVLGLDADMFLQALLCEVPHVYLIDPFAGAGSSNACFSVDRWRRALAASHSKGNDRRLALDFSLIVLMSGSDYVPSLRFANYRTLWPAYLTLHEPAVDAEEPAGKRVCVEWSFLVDAEKKSVNLAALKQCYQRYLKTVFSDSLRAGLEAQHASLDTSSSSERILKYFEHLIWNLDALITAHTPDDPGMTDEIVPPSLLELAAMPCELLQVQLDERLAKKVKVYEERPPGVMALMLLDPNSDCESYLPSVLRPIFVELKDKQLTDAQLASEATSRINQLSSLSIQDKLTIFPRTPLVLSPESKVERNFFTAATAIEAFAVKNTSTLPWLRPYVYSVDEKEASKCPLYQNLFKEKCV